MGQIKGITTYTVLGLLLLGQFSFAQTQNGRSSTWLNDRAWDLRHQDSDSAFWYAEKALQLAQKTGDFTEELTSLRRQGLLFLFQNQLDSAISHYQNANAIAVLQNDSTNNSKTLNDLGIVHRHAGAFNLALRYLNQSLSLKKELQDSSGIANTLMNIGCVALSKGEMLKCIKSFRQELEIRTELKDSSGLSGTYLNIGNYYLVQGEDSKAFNSYSKARKLAQHYGQSALIQKVDENLPLLVLDSSIVLQVIFNFDSAINSSKQNGDSINLLNYYLRAGILAERHGNLKKGLDHFIAAEKIGEALGKERKRIRALTWAGTTMLKMDQVEKAKTSLTKAFQLAEKSGIINEQKKILISLEQIARMKGEFESANNLSRQLIQLLDTLYNAENLSEQNQHQAVIEMMLHDRHLVVDRLEKAQKLAEAEIVDSNRKFYIATTLLLFVLLISIVLFYRGKLRQSKIVNQNLQKERQRIGEELHGELGGKTQAVISFLHVFADGLKLTPAKKRQFDQAVSEAQRLSQIARDIAHNKLGITLSKRGLKGMVEKMAEDLKNASSLEINFEVSKISQNLNQKIELTAYRIITELINNSLKHANATSVKLEIFTRGNNLEIEYEDNGAGIKPDDPKVLNGAGLNNMRFRVKELRGKFLMESSDGLRFRITLPLDA